MTGVLQEDLRRVEALPDDEQDAIASRILDTLNDEESWAQSFRQNPEQSRSQVPEALKEHQRGDTLAAEDLLG